MNNTVAGIEELLLSQEMPLPPIPREMSDKLCCISNSQYYSNRTDIPSPWRIQWFMEEFMSKPVEDYLVVGYAGHGVESYALHYYLVTSNLAVFFQIAAETPYRGIPAENSDILEKQYRLISSLEIAIEQAKLSGLFDETSRLVISKPLFMMPRWGVQNKEKNTVDNWEFANAPLVGAATWLADQINN
ncbi:hypothetical protein [uncultured Endozoicomonas sp.]|uniref:hypothetical protein n=1 Tax=uncultured Endozoicomonas sp. TaxID=432652 RepID=UPI0026206085|nr:hypothetical protein [uncultured Endozoicomonas sp.]